MKILIATDTYYPHVNGAAYFTYRLAHALSTAGHQVFVIAPSESFTNTKKVDKAVVVYGMRSVPIPNYPKFRVSPSPLHTMHSVEKIVKEISPDIIHLQQHFLISKTVFAVGKKLNIPMIGTNHFLPENLTGFLSLPKAVKNKIISYGWHQFLKVFDELQVVTTPTATAAKFIQDIGLNKNVVPVSNGIDLKRFKPSTQKDYIRSRYHTDNGKILLFVGRLDKDKRLDLVLQAMPMILQKCNIQLVIAGIGSQRGKLETQSSKLGIDSHVTFTGFILDKDLPQLYQGADAFIIAGIAELQSIATMEAMASGLPIIAADSKALPELVKNGKNGFLFPPDNKKILALSVISLFTNEKLRLQMARASLKRIKYHDINKTIYKYENLYRKLVAQNPKNTRQTTPLVEKRENYFVHVLIALIFFAAAILSIFLFKKLLIK